MDRKTLSLLVVPDDGGRVRRFRLPVVSVWAVGAAAATFVAVFLVAIVVFWNAHRVNSKWTDTARENEVLRQDLAALETELSDFELRLKSTEDMENKARLLAGLEPLDETARRLAVGGPELAIPPDGLDARLSGRLNQVQQRLTSMQQNIGIQEASYREVLDALQERADELERTPTVTPVRGDYYLSSGFGRRIDPFTGHPAMHEGYDFVAAKGTPFHATARGTVLIAGRNGAFGLTVKVDHENGIVTVYGHADKLFVKRGEKVERGQVLGVVGATGRTTGPHLHYEVQVDKRPISPGQFILDRNHVVD